MKIHNYLFKLFSFIILSISMFSCVVPVNTSMEGPRMLRKGQGEVTASYSRNSIGNEGVSETVNNNYGLRVGYGISDKVDLKLRYVRLVTALEDVDEGSSLNYLSIAPKISIKDKVLAFNLPFGIYFTEGENTEFISPQVLLGHSFASNKVDLYLNTKLDIFLEEEATNYFGLNIGAAFSSDLDKWAVRPEFGYMLALDEEVEGHIITLGLGFSFLINK